MTTINKQISLGTDDCDETNDSTAYLMSTTISVGRSFIASNDMGLRWQAVNIPQGTTITSAKLSLYASTDSGTLSANIQGVDEDNTATWYPSSRPSQRTKTTAVITANEANWNNWGTDCWVDIDITSVIQEIINRVGWSANNALAIVLENTAGSYTNMLTVRSYEHTGNLHGAKLEIVYSAATAKPVWYYNMLKRRNN